MTSFLMLGCLGDHVVEFVGEVAGQAMAAVTTVWF